MSLLTNDQINELKNFNVPTIANAIEIFNIRPRTKGFMSSDIKSIFSYDEPQIGYACTGKISAKNLPGPGAKKMLKEYYAYVKDAPSPSFAVIEDTDPYPIGSFWGEVHANIHDALGCISTITNGGVRDLDEVKELNFGYYASCVLVSHAYVHIKNYNCTVYIGGLEVKPGDLLIADKHGVISIPHEIAPDLADACRDALYAEEPVIKGCKSKGKDNLDIDELWSWREELWSRREEIVKRRNQEQ